MRKLLLTLLLCLAGTAAQAQNVTCPNRPGTDSSNACANTRFVQTAPISPEKLPTPTLSTLGAIYAFNGVASQWPWQLNTDGTFTLRQPTFADLAAGQVTITTAFSGQNFFAPAGNIPGTNWLKTYAYGDNNTSIVGLNRTGGGVAISGAARASDSSGGSVAPIGLVGWGFTDGQGAKAGYPSWGVYGESRAYSSTTGYAQGAEFEITNGNASVVVQDPYNQYQPGGTNGLIIGSGGACGVQFTVTGAVNNGSGAVRLAVNSVNNINTGQSVTVSGVGGVSGANGTFVVTVIDSTHIDLVSSTFSGAYTSGGTGVRGAPCYDPITGLVNMYAKAASSAIRISPNDGTFASAIVIGCGAFTGSDCTDGSTGGTALGMPIASALDWYAAGNVRTFTIRSTAKSTDLIGMLQWSNEGVSFINKTTGNSLFQFYPGATSVNGVKMISAAAGSAPSINAFGSDTDISLTVQGKGAGLANIVSPTFNGSTGYVYANGAGAATYSTTIPASSLSGSSLPAGITGSSLTSVGTLTSLTVAGTVTVNASAFNMTSASAFQPQMTFFNQNNGTYGGYYILQKGRGAAGSGASAVQVGDILGSFIFKGLDSNGAAQNSSSAISAIVDTVGAGSVTSHLSISGSVVFGGSINAASLPTTGGTIKGTLCVDTVGVIYVKTTAGACL